MSLPTELRNFDQRKARAASIISRFPDKVPLIIKKSSKDQTNIMSITAKYLVPRYNNVADIMRILREHVKLTDIQAIYLICGNAMLSGSQNIGTVYDSNKSADGFLYIEYCTENAFG